jgi:hypothetical protein
MAKNRDPFGIRYLLFDRIESSSISKRHRKAIEKWISVVRVRVGHSVENENVTSRGSHDGIT